MASLPGVFWFDQFRNLASTGAKDETGGFSSNEYSGAGVVNDSAARMSYPYGISRLREFLVRWKTYQLSRGARAKGPDFLSELETLYQQVFPGRKFGPLEPMYDNAPTPSGFYFTFDDGNRTYDIEEMSAGEQAAFPILYEIVRQQVSNSVVLIDEIDLNLHPPLAQMLLGSLPFWGHDNQFLFTTHSRAVSEIMDPNCIYRLPGGRSCL